METSLPSTVPLQNLLSLSVPEKLALIGLLEDSMDDAALPLRDWQLAELERREVAELIAPEPTVSWTEAVQQVRSRHANSRST